VVVDIVFMRFLKIVLTFLFSNFIVICSANAVVINEIMYDPPDSLGGAYNEWIELYNPENETVNLTGWSVMDFSDASNHSVYGSLEPYSFIILAKNTTTFNKYYNSSCNVTKSSFSLSNTEGGIILKNSTKGLADVMNYSNLLGGNDTGESLQKIGCLWLPSVPTPCGHNIFQNNTENQTNSTGNNITDDTCDLRVWIDGDQIFTSENHEYSLMTEDINGGDFEPEVEYWIEDMFGTIVRTKTKTNNTNTIKSWEPPDVAGTEAYFIRAVITGEPCNDTNSSNNYAGKIIVFKGRPRNSWSEIKILDVDSGSDMKANFGDHVEVRINAYKGDTGKSAIDVWLENAGGKKAGKTSLNVYEKFSNHTISAPLQISPNCDNELPDGTYLVKAEGIDSYDESEMIIEGISPSSCKTIEKTKSCSCPVCQKCENKSVAEKIGKNTTKENKISELNKTTVISENISGVSKGNKILNETPRSNETRTPTGKIISKNDDNWFSSAINSFINFFKNLFKL